MGTANHCNVCAGDLTLSRVYGGLRVVCAGCKSYGAVSFAGRDAAISLWNRVQHSRPVIMGFPSPSIEVWMNV